MESVFNLPRAKVSEVESFRLSDTYGMTREEELHFWSKYEFQLCGGSLLAEQRIKQILEDYTDEHTRIFVITSRDYKYYDITKLWLEHIGFKHTALFCVGKNSKLPLIKILKAEAVFEDNPLFFEEVLEKGLKNNFDTFCIDYPYNKNSICDIRLDRNTGKPM